MPKSMEASLSSGVPESSESSGERRFSTLARQMWRKRSPSCFSCMLCFAAPAQICCQDRNKAAMTVQQKYQLLHVLASRMCQRLHASVMRIWRNV